MSEINDLEARAAAALAKLSAGNGSEQGDNSENMTEVMDELASTQEKLEKEQRVHEALQVEFLDVCQNFGGMELDTMQNQSASSDHADALAKLKAERENDIKDVEVILAQLTPIVES